jgi:hypothetical protein
VTLGVWRIRTNEADTAVCQTDGERPRASDRAQRLRFERRFKHFSSSNVDHPEGLPKCDWASFCADVDAVEVS